jgi:hypothetical protein
MRVLIFQTPPSTLLGVTLSHLSKGQRMRSQTPPVQVR